MYTHIILDRGCLRTTIISGQDEQDQERDVSKGRWRAAIAPAISFLRSQGGGDCYVAHQPSEIAP